MGRPLPDFCPHCGVPVRRGGLDPAGACWGCGPAAAAAETAHALAWKCLDCGTPLGSDEAVCPRCGADKVGMFLEMIAGSRRGEA